MPADNQKFLEFLAPIREVLDASYRANLCFWLGIWYEPDKADAKAANYNTGPDTMFALELGKQLRPFWGEVSDKIWTAIVAAAVSALLAAIGLKK